MQDGEPSSAVVHVSGNLQHGACFKPVLSTKQITRLFHWQNGSLVCMKNWEASNILHFIWTLIIVFTFRTSGTRTCVWKEGGFSSASHTGPSLYWLVIDNMIRIDYSILEATKLWFNTIYLFSINRYLYIFFSQRYSARLTRLLGALSTPERDQTYRESSLELTDCLNGSRPKYIINKTFNLRKKSLQNISKRQ